MQMVKRKELEKLNLPGRIIQKAFGRESFIASGKMTMGFGHYSSSSGRMEPHCHAEEIVYILGAKKGKVVKL